MRARTHVYGNLMRDMTRVRARFVAFRRNTTMTAYSSYARTIGLFESGWPAKVLIPLVKVER